tara:strand:+ start:1748 stop:3142 length:1395 start_codon:yes stop_codon:yes gene_type:complete
MQDSIKDDLILFNQIVNEFLDDEKLNPISKKINIEDLSKKIDLSLGDSPTIKKEFADTLRKLILATPKSSSALFFNQLFGGRNSKAVIGDLLAVLLNNSMATYKISGPQVGVEKEILLQVKNLIGYKENYGGTFPTGGSMSNFMSLIIARDKKNLDIRNTGVNQKLIMYASDNAHYSIAKNASFSGIGRDNVRYIKSNSFGCLDVKLLEEAINIDLKRGYTPFYINATAGTTVLGAFDNIKGISKISKKYKLWLHVDGAWGGAVLFSKSYNKLIAGVENSDSFCFNAHKSLGVPLSSSVLLVADKKDLYNSFSNEASYLYQTHDNDYNLGQTSFECGRRNNSLKLWTMWKAIGTSGISKVIDHQFTLADYARSYVRGSKDYKLYSFDDSLSICFNYKSYDPEDLCTKLYDLNRLMIGFGFFGKQSFIRLVIINSSNSEKEIFNFFKIIEEFTLEHHKSIKSIDI